MSRKVVERTSEEYFDFDGMTVLYLLEKFNKILQEKGDTAYIYADYVGYDGAKNFHLGWTEVESDEEYERRLSFEKQERQKAKLKKEQADQKEREEYERLKKKFEGSNK